MGAADRSQLLVVTRALSIAACALLAACSSTPIRHADGSTSAHSFSLKELAKSDVDSVVEMHQHAVLASLRTLTVKLYRRNPQQAKKSGHASAESASDAVFRPLSHWRIAARIDWQARLNDAWRDDYPGDRVQALMQGLLAMTLAAYNDRTEFYLLSELDAQKLYNSARNLEAVAWKLSNARDAQGGLILLSNSDAPGVANLSFEREFGKLIALQDVLARVIEDKSNRAIRFGVVNAATMVFLPI